MEPIHLSGVVTTHDRTTPCLVLLATEDNRHLACYLTNHHEPTLVGKTIRGQALLRDDGTYFLELDQS